MFVHRRRHVELVVLLLALAGRRPLPPVSTPLNVPAVADVDQAAQRHRDRGRPPKPRCELTTIEPAASPGEDGVVAVHRRPSGSGRAPARAGCGDDRAERHDCSVATRHGTVPLVPPSAADVAEDDAGPGARRPGSGRRRCRSCPPPAAASARRTGRAGRSGSAAPGSCPFAAPAAVRRVARPGDRADQPVLARAGR